MFNTYSLQFVTKRQPEVIEELNIILADIYDAIAMDAFGVNGATSKWEYVSVMADHLSWSEDTLMSDDARHVYHSLTLNAQRELVGRSYPGEYTSK